MATVTFNSTTVCAEIAEKQFEIFAAGHNDTTAVVIGEIVLAVPYTASPKLLNMAAQVTGRILVIQRGGSTNLDKAVRAQAAGAVGVVIVNNVAGDAVTMPGDFGAITIPVVMVPRSVDASLRASEGLSLTIARARGDPAIPTPPVRTSDKLADRSPHAYIRAYRGHRCLTCTRAVRCPRVRASAGLHTRRMVIGDG